MSKALSLSTSADQTVKIALVGPLKSKAGKTPKFAYSFELQTAIRPM
jgi:hypothetical protein